MESKPKTKTNSDAVTCTNIQFGIHKRKEGRYYHYWDPSYHQDKDLRNEDLQKSLEVTLRHTKSHFTLFFHNLNLEADNVSESYKLIKSTSKISVYCQLYYQAIEKIHYEHQEKKLILFLRMSDSPVFYSTIYEEPENYKLGFFGARKEDSILGPFFSKHLTIRLEMDNKSYFLYTLDGLIKEKSLLIKYCKIETETKISHYSEIKFVRYADILAANWNFNSKFAFLACVTTTKIYPSIENFEFVNSRYNAKPTDKIANPELVVERTLRKIVASEYIFPLSEAKRLWKNFPEYFEKNTVKMTGAENEEKDFYVLKKENKVLVKKIVVRPNYLVFSETFTNLNPILHKYITDSVLINDGLLIKVDFKGENQPFDLLYHEIIKNLYSQYLKKLEFLGREYHHFIYGNSQIKKNKLWMISASPEDHLNRLKQFGEVKEKNFGLLGKRLGQLLSTSVQTISIKTEMLQRIEDIKINNGKSVSNFTDGCGLISLVLMEKVQKFLELSEMPSAIQIRIGSLKGMLLLDPDFNLKEKIKYRPSMKKFDVDENGELWAYLNIIGYSKTKKGYLDQDTTLMLVERGIPSKTIKAVLRKNLSLLTKINRSKSLLNDEFPLFFEGVDEKLIKNSNLENDIFWSKFWRYYQACKCFQFERNKYLSIEESAICYGVCDPLGLLEADELCLNLSDPIADDKLKASKMLLITKNPCKHVGDVRTYKLRCRPELSYLKDVLIFPVKGTRPIPDMMAGSDLDGDKFLIIWDRDLIPEGDNFEPHQYGQIDKYEDANFFLHSFEESSMAGISNFYQEYMTRFTNIARIIEREHKNYVIKYGSTDERALKLLNLYSFGLDFQKNDMEIILRSLVGFCKKEGLYIRELSNEIEREENSIITEDDDYNEIDESYLRDQFSLKSDISEEINAYLDKMHDYKDFEIKEKRFENETPDETEDLPAEIDNRILEEIEKEVEKHVSTMFFQDDLLNNYNEDNLKPNKLYCAEGYQSYLETAVRMQMEYHQLMDDFLKDIGLKNEFQLFYTRFVILSEKSEEQSFTTKYDCEKQMDRKVFKILKYLKSYFTSKYFKALEDDEERGKLASALYVVANKFKYHKKFGINYLALPWLVGMKYLLSQYSKNTNAPISNN